MASTIKTFVKDPDETLDYTADWTQWLANESGDSITSYTWIVPTPLTGLNQSNGSAISTLFIGGGVLGKLYEIVSRITTNGGKTRDKTMRLLIQQR